MEKNSESNGHSYRLGSVLTMLIILMAFPAASFADVAENPEENRYAAGMTVDLLPTVLSAVSGKPGYSLQVWAGYDRYRVRLVGASMRLPDSLAASDGFEKRDLQVGAVIFDYFFNGGFSGFWAGTGFEYWRNSIQHENADRRSRWSNAVFTIGGGYVWKVYGNLYVEPWTAAHLVLDDNDGELAGERYRPERLSAEISLKAGYFFEF